jgi:hypothetical protein
MNLEKLYLTKEELPILYENCFQIPIHPKLLNPKISIDKSIVQRIFPKVVDEWYKDLKEKGLTGKMTFEDSCIAQYSANGFVEGFQISRDFGGNIFFDKIEDGCRTVIPNKFIRFQKEKAIEFQCQRIRELSLAHVYNPGNVDNPQGALFLRDWGIEYMNEVFKQIF